MRGERRAPGPRPDCPEARRAKKILLLSNYEARRLLTVSRGGPGSGSWLLPPRLLPVRHTSHSLTLSPPTAGALLRARNPKSRVPVGNLTTEHCATPHPQNKQIHKGPGPPRSVVKFLFPVYLC